MSLQQQLQYGICLQPPVNLTTSLALAIPLPPSLLLPRKSLQRSTSRSADSLAMIRCWRIGCLLHARCCTWCTKGIRKRSQFKSANALIRDDIPPSADPVISAIQVNRDAFTSGSMHAEQFGRSLQELTLNIYSQLVNNIQENFQQLLVPAFLREDQTIVSRPRSPPQRGGSMAQISAPTGPTSPTPIHPSAAIPSLNQLTNHLTFVLTLLRDARLPPAVIRQFFKYVLFYSRKL